MTTKLQTLRDPASALTHLAGLVMTLLAAPPLLHRAQGGQVWPMAAFLCGMALLYAASTAYHWLRLSPAGTLCLQRIDHMMIFLLIAGSYTPICLLVLPHTAGLILFSVIWGAALSGMVVKFFFVGCPKWVSSALYLVLGWACLPVIAVLWRALPRGGFALLLAGGVFYSVGAVIYALKLPGFNARHPHFPSHAVFHLFVLAGSACHYALMYGYLVPLFPAG